MSNLKHFVTQVARSIKKDLTTTNKSNNVFIFACINLNLEETSKGKYNKLLTENIKKKPFNIANRVDRLVNFDGSTILKNHKENFNANMKSRLRNPSKNKLGKVRNFFIESINKKIRKLLLA